MRPRVLDLFEFFDCGGITVVPCPGHLIVALRGRLARGFDKTLTPRHT